ncbi:hypothetical protein VPNG_02165 [Cytospora leucostoma]|uniref:Uncharacterized protein n=1 Tax=Cytospora leucostoma TaxID=1230097 RepID=A0A423XGY5_9PEZI|nr:hypothetical protein VPNG_02165 [Cytospora leucostoma]
MASPPKLVYLITGCSSGLGYTLAKAALTAGHTVIATSRNPSKTPDKLAEVESLGGRWATLDVSSPSLEAQFRETILPVGGKIDVLINNAGIGRIAIVEDIQLDVARDVFETNFWGLVRLTKLAVAAMRAQGGGTIVNVGSETSLSPKPLTSIYSASKGAVDGFTVALAAEVAPFNIRVLLVTPGGIRTPFVENGATGGGGTSLREEYRGTPAEFVLGVMLEPANFHVDPHKAAEVIIHAVDGTGPFERTGRGFVRLPLGGETLAGLESRIGELRGALDGFGDVAKSVDFGG